MTLRDDATAAWQAAQSGREADARAALAAVLTPEDTSALTIAATLHDAGVLTFILTDGDLHLAVSQPDANPGTWAVALVLDDSGWTRVGTVTSLATLGKLAPLVPAPPPAVTYPEWGQPTGSTDAYAKGDRVTHNGLVWESLVDANVWEPGVSQWREVTG